MLRPGPQKVQHKEANSLNHGRITDGPGLCHHPDGQEDQSGRLNPRVYQEDAKGGPGSCGSQYISVAEKNYVMVELELLALQWGTEKSHLYLLGAPFCAITDHQPLVLIVN